MTTNQPAFPELEALKTKAVRTTDRVEKLQLMKQYVDKARAITAEDQGRVKQIELQRAQEFGCATDVEAEEYIKELEGDIAALETELEAGVATIEEELGWTNV